MYFRDDQNPKQDIHPHGVRFGRHAEDGGDAMSGNKLNQTGSPHKIFTDSAQNTPPPILIQDRRE